MTQHNIVSSWLLRCIRGQRTELIMVSEFHPLRFLFTIELLWSDNDLPIFFRIIHDVYTKQNHTANIFPLSFSLFTWKRDTRVVQFIDRIVVRKARIHSAAIDPHFCCLLKDMRSERPPMFSLLRYLFREIIACVSHRNIFRNFRSYAAQVVLWWNKWWTDLWHGRVSALTLLTI